MASSQLGIPCCPWHVWSHCGSLYLAAWLWRLSPKTWTFAQIRKRKALSKVLLELCRDRFWLCCSLLPWIRFLVSKWLNVKHIQDMTKPWRKWCPRDPQRKNMARTKELWNWTFLALFLAFKHFALHRAMLCHASACQGCSIDVCSVWTWSSLIDVHIGVDVPSSGLRMCTSHWLWQNPGCSSTSCRFCYSSPLLWWTWLPGISWNTSGKNILYIIYRYIYTYIHMYTLYFYLFIYFFNLFI